MKIAPKTEILVSAVISRIDQAGRISISAQQRRALGLEGGSPIVISVVGNELRIRSMSAAMAELQMEAGQFLQNEASSVDAFIAQRHRDAEAEEEPTPTHRDPGSGSAPGPGPEQKERPEPVSELEPEPEPEPVSEREPERLPRPKPRTKR